MKIAIIGAGAAGCFAAANLPKGTQYEIAVFEKTGKALQKVKISGGGRCNLTHNLPPRADPKHYYPRGWQLLRKTLPKFDTVSWFQQRGVTIKTEPDGRMFPVSDSSQTIIDCLLREMKSRNVQLHFHKSIQQISIQPNSKFLLVFDDGSEYVADKVLIAVGGSPKLNSYTWIRDLGHSLVDPVPSLFTFNLPAHAITNLQGISVPNVTIRLSGTKIEEQGAILITHWGLSGPAVLRASAWGARELAKCNYRFDVQIDWLPHLSEIQLRENFQQWKKEKGSQLIINNGLMALPKRLWTFLVQSSSISSDLRWADLSLKAAMQLISNIKKYPCSVLGKTTFKEEFVTAGGIPLSEVDSDTMQSKIVPSIYFAGEVLDVDGITGGFNFQHAWSSAWLAANHMSI